MSSKSCMKQIIGIFKSRRTHTLFFFFPSKKKLLIYYNDTKTDHCSYCDNKIEVLSQYTFGMRFKIHNEDRNKTSGVYRSSPKTPEIRKLDCVKIIIYFTNLTK